MKCVRRQFLHLAAGAVALPALSCFARAQVYPSRPVRIIVGWAAGGPSDIAARLIGQSTIITTGGIVANPLALSNDQSFAQGVVGNSQFGVKALLFDMFGTVLDWRTGVARSVEIILKPRGYTLDWFAFADGWRAMYQPGMADVREGRIPYTRLDILHRRMLDKLLPKFGISGLPEDVLHDLTLSWHRLDGWPDVPTAFPP
jgi:hypothetical protein